MAAESGKQPVGRTGGCRRPRPRACTVPLSIVREGTGPIAHWAMVWVYQALVVRVNAGAFGPEVFGHPADLQSISDQQVVMPFSPDGSMGFCCLKLVKCERIGGLHG
jgi:hypothetical protein